VARFGALFHEFYGTVDEVLHRRDAEWLFNQVKGAAGIHFSTFDDKSAATPQEEEAIQAGAATVRSNHKPTPQEKARMFVPLDPNADRGIKILETR
jgi:hypothetical protein